MDQSLGVGHSRASAQRAGGREARKADRARSKMAEVVRPGMSGGQYKPLCPRDMQRIHETALDVLERIGMADPIPATLKRALAAGCWLNKHDRLCFPRALVEDVVAGAPRTFPIFARDPAHDRMVGEDRVHFCTAGEAVQVIDFGSGGHRPSTLVDLYDYYRLADRLEHIHHVGQPIVATDIEDIRAHNLSVAYAGMAGTKKSFGFSMANAEHVDEVVALADMVIGEEGGFLKRPFFQIGHCPVVSPLRFGKDTSEVQVRCAELGIVSDMCVAPQAGATAPAALAGALVQACAETLASLVQAHLTRRGARMFFGNWVFVSDLRTGAFTGGSGEEAVLMAAAAQMAQFYQLPGSVAAGMTDSKVLDYQAGFEKGLTVALAGLAGGNMVYEAAGMMSSLLATSFESMVMDNDLLGTVQRALRGIEVTDDTLSFEVIEDVVLRGPNHYLGHAQTLKLMQSEFLYPEVSDRQTLSVWSSSGRPSACDHARVRVREILSAHYPVLVDDALDAAIRARFPIRLAAGDMRATSGRW